MSSGIGKGRTRPEHRGWSDQLYATYARGRKARTMAAIVGESGLPPADRRALAFSEAFERDFIAQPAVAHHRRDLPSGLDAARDAPARLFLAHQRGDLAGAPELREEGDAMSGPARRAMLQRLAEQRRVNKGIALTRRRREALAAELFKLARPAVDVRSRLAEAVNRATSALADALAEHGESALNAIAWPVREPVVELQPAQVGLPCSDVVGRTPLSRTLEVRAVDPGSVGLSAAACASRYEELAELLIGRPRGSSACGAWAKRSRRPRAACARSSSGSRRA